MRRSHRLSRYPIGPVFTGFIRRGPGRDPTRPNGQWWPDTAGIRDRGPPRGAPRGHDHSGACVPRQLTAAPGRMAGDRTLAGSRAALRQGAIAVGWSPGGEGLRAATSTPPQGTAPAQAQRQRPAQIQLFIVDTSPWHDNSGSQRAGIFQGGFELFVMRLLRAAIAQLRVADLAPGVGYGQDSRLDPNDCASPPARPE